MLKYCTIIGASWVIVCLILGIELADYHSRFISYIASRQMDLCIWTGLGSVVVFSFIYLLDKLGCHSMMYLAAKLLLETGLMLVCFVSIAALLVYFDLGFNFWSELGISSFVPFAWLITALCCIRLFDFNYPVQDTLLFATLVPLLSAMLVFGAAYLF